MRRSTKLGLDAGDLYKMHLQQTLEGRLRGRSGLVAVMLQQAASCRAHGDGEGHKLFLRRAASYRKTGAAA